MDSLNQLYQNYPEQGAKLLRSFYARLAPPASGSVAEWAENERYLSSESSAEPGKWRNDSAPHTIKPMQCLSPSSTFDRVVCKWSSQSGKTEIANNFVGFAMDVDPGPILVVQPNVKPMGEAWSKDRLAPMVRDTPALKKVGGIDTNKQKSENTILHKVFPGGHITVAGANSPAGLASRPIRYLVMDEIDRFETTKEGSPLSLARKRMLTFKSRGLGKELNVSSPTFEDIGIDAEYKSCDQWNEWQLKCFHCNEYQMPKFKHFDFDIEHGSPKDIGYTCEHCGTRYTQDDERKIKLSGTDIETKNTGIKSIGFWFNQFASPFSTWEGTIHEFLESKDDPTKLQSVINTAFCECWEEPGEKVESNVLIEQAKDFEHEAPDGVLYITFGTDVQSDRLELEVVGWGKGERSWSLDYHIIEGATDNRTKGAWVEHTELIKERYKTKDGFEIPVSGGCIDSGYQTSTVCDYVRSLKHSKIWAVKGATGQKRPFVEGRDKRALRLRKRSKTGYRPELIGVDEGKTILYKRFILKPFEDEDGTPIYPPGYCHFPRRDQEYFEQLVAEKIQKRRSRGHLVREWVKTRDRNEALDCRNYAFAALRLCNPNFNQIKFSKPVPIKDIPKNRRLPARKSGGFVNSWRT